MGSIGLRLGLPAVLLLAASPSPALDKARKVLLVGVDGVRPDCLKSAKTPSFNGLIKRGAYSLNAQTCALTISGPSWGSLLTGVWPARHGIVDNEFTGYRRATCPHFFRRLKESSGGLVTASIVAWKPLNHHLLGHADIAHAAGSDEEVARSASFVVKYLNPDVLFLHFDQVDAAGHKHGYGRGVEEYLAAIETVDRLVGKVLKTIRTRQEYLREEWLVVVGTDHGGTDKGHGQDIPEHRTVFVIVSGGSAERGRIKGDVTVVDIPPTIAAFLGVEVDPAWGWEGHAVGLRPPKSASAGAPGSFLARPW